MTSSTHTMYHSLTLKLAIVLVTTSFLSTKAISTQEKQQDIATTRSKTTSKSDLPPTAPELLRAPNIIVPL
ncbi:hypothetical protein Y032_0068g162 [Ancylostoma ceylanicum]|uniref:Uncharacterized protein n=1 Tax=Ancylostoma ceylanicum TaxID=53326 RepID=A0A016TZQ2_9BILA|nr:hypothetical protein Y032_0068g162 [Ancylostoma ceylanicum]